ncbi:MAG: hypothetical protein R3B72_38810 [Polyangiaceae bacterium]
MRTVVLRIALRWVRPLPATLTFEGLEPQRRNRVSFRAPHRYITETYSTAFPSSTATWPRYDLKRTPVVIDDTRHSMSVSWFEDKCHRIKVTRESATTEWVLTHQGPRDCEVAIADWLEAEDATSAQDWRSGADSENGVPRMATPW